MMVFVFVMSLMTGRPPLYTCTDTLFPATTLCRSRGLGGHGMALYERRHRLPEEDREREIPRRDRRPYPASVEMQHVALAGRAGQLDRLQVGARAGGIIAAEINRRIGRAHV